MANLSSDLSLPTVAWPTVLLALASVSLWAVSASLYALGVWPWWATLLLSTACAYVAFTPMHDASHRSVARARWVNEVVGRACSLVLMAPFAAFRWVHLEHHRFTNDPARDPDYWSGRGPLRLLRWGTQDLHYYGRYLGARRPGQERLEVLAMLGALVAASVVLGLTGKGALLLVAWFLPARLAISVLAWAFDYLPHRPHDVLASEDRFRATSVLEGPAILTPLLLAQNLHLVHHLFPAVPFYRYGRVWRSQGERLRAQGARIERFPRWWPRRPERPASLEPEGTEGR